MRSGRSCASRPWPHPTICFGLGLIPVRFGAYYAPSTRHRHSESRPRGAPFGIRVAVIEPLATNPIEATLRSDRPARPLHSNPGQLSRGICRPMPLVPAEDVAATILRAAQAGVPQRATRQARPRGKPLLPGGFCRARCSTGPCASSSAWPDPQTRLDPDMEPAMTNSVSHLGTGTGYADAPNRSITVTGTSFAYRELGPRGGVPGLLNKWGAWEENFDPSIAMAAQARIMDAVNYGDRPVGGTHGTIANGTG